MSATPVSASESVSVSVSAPTLFSIYTEADRVMDRAICRNYLCGWAGTFGAESTALPHKVITRADFEAAAARLAQPAL